jgi:hypothetical protein
MKTTINNGDSGLIVRNALNAMFTELYNNINPPLKLPASTGNPEAAIPANSLVTMILMRPTPGASGTPTVSIGSTGGGTDIFDATAITTFAIVNYNEYFYDGANIYFTITGGTVDIVIFTIPNLF